MSEFSKLSPISLVCDHHADGRYIDADKNYLVTSIEQMSNKPFAKDSMAFERKWKHEEHSISGTEIQ